MSATALLKQLSEAFDARAAAGLDVTIQFACDEPTHARICNGQCELHPGTADVADLTVSIDDDDLVALLSGELNGMTAFMQGRLQVDGDLLLAQRLTQLFHRS